MKNILTSALLTAALALGGAPAFAEDLDGVVRAEVRTGWRGKDGVHVAAIHLSIREGWKTYWRAPGDAGIPPRFIWTGNSNAQAINIEWPTPSVFWQSGMRSVGYHNELVLPLRIEPGDRGGDITLNGEMEIGLCEEICLPYTVSIKGVLPAADTRRDPVIAAALVSRPYSGDEAGVRAVTCRIEPIDGGMRVTARIDMPSAGADEEIVMEAGNPAIWVSQPKSQRQGEAIETTADFRHVEGKAFALDRSALRITVLGTKHAVDILGCTG